MGDYYIVDRGGSYIIVDDLNTIKNMSAALSGQSEFVSFDDAVKAIDNLKINNSDLSSSSKIMVLPKSTTIKGLREKYNKYSGWVFLITYNNSYATGNGITSDAQDNNIKVFFNESSARRDINYRKKKW